VTMHL